MSDEKEGRNEAAARQVKDHRTRRDVAVKAAAEKKD